MAAKFPCPNPPGLCDQVQNPTTQFSSESADSTTFIGLAWAPQVPALNKYFSVYACEAIADSQLSQADADRIAANQAVVCSNPCLPVLYNTAQTASANCPNGAAYFFTVPAGQYAANSQLIADRTAFTVAAQSLIGHSVCLGALAPDTVCEGQFYFGIISVVSPDTVTLELIAGAMPAGVTLDLESTRAVLSGTPVVFGSYTFTLRATSSAGVYTQQTYTLNIGGILTTPGALPKGNLGAAYSTQLQAFPLNGQAAQWAIISGSLPTGLAIDPAAGTISGTPSSPGDFNFTAQATTGSAVCTAQFSIHIDAVNWGATVWSLIKNTVGGGAGGQGTGTYVGANFSVAAKGNSFPDGLSEALGTLTYAGPTVVCKALITLTASGADALGFFIQQDGITRMSINLQGVAPGSYEIDFAIVATAGSTILIRGFTDIGDPARVFVLSANNQLGAYSVFLTNQ